MSSLGWTVLSEVQAFLSLAALLVSHGTSDATGTVNAVPCLSMCRFCVRAQVREVSWKS